METTNKVKEETLTELVYSSADIIYSIREKLEVMNARLRGEDVATRPSAILTGLTAASESNKLELLGISNLIDEIYRKLY